MEKFLDWLIEKADSKQVDAVLIIMIIMIFGTMLVHSMIF
jgi:hypothetical protein